MVAGTLFTAMQVRPATAVAQDPIVILRTESEYQRLDDRYTLRMRAFGFTAALLEIAGVIGFVLGDPPHGNGGLVLGIFSGAAIILSGAVGIAARRRGLLRDDGYMPDSGAVLLRF
jgi:hypothetical protein